MTAILYDAPRCPYCARTRIVLAEKDVAHERVEVDLGDRPQLVRDLNPPGGRVPIWREGDFVLPESSVINEHLEQLEPSPPLLPADPRGRALARLLVYRFDAMLGDAYYALRRRGGDEEQAALDGALRGLAARLEETEYLAGNAYTLADVSYVPWLLRAEELLGVDVRAHAPIAAWLERLAARPAIAAEAALVAALA